MSGERVTERVRVHGALARGVARPRAQAASDIGRREPAAGLGEEQRAVAGGAFGSPREGGPATLQPAPDGLQRLLAGGHEARLAALALDPHLLVVEVDRADVEVDELLRPEPAGVGELEQ